MSLPKLLVTGISGFLGSYIAGINQNDWEVYGIYNQTKVNYPKLKTIQTNLLDDQALENIFKTLKPNAVLHLAALSDANFCEANPGIAEKINVKLSIRIARLCRELKIPLLFTSSDLVFDGKHPPYDESSPTNAVNQYGKQKIEAEREMMAIYSEVCIARLPVMFGIPQWGNSFMKSWLDNLKENKNIFAFTDEFRTKVSGESAAEGLFLLLNKKAKGIWHLGGKERISRFDFAVQMASIFDLPRELIIASKQSEVKMNAARPPDVSLNSKKAFSLGYHPLEIKAALNKIHKICV